MIRLSEADDHFWGGIAPSPKFYMDKLFQRFITYIRCPCRGTCCVESCHLHEVLRVRGQREESVCGHIRPNGEGLHTLGEVLVRGDLDGEASLIERVILPVERHGRGGTA